MAGIASVSGWVAVFELSSPGLPKNYSQQPLTIWQDYCNDGFTEMQGWVMTDPYGQPLSQAVPATFFPGFRTYQLLDT